MPGRKGRILDFTLRIPEANKAGGKEPPPLHLLKFF